MRIADYPARMRIKPPFFLALFIYIEATLNNCLSAEDPDGEEMGMLVDRWLHSKGMAGTSSRQMMMLT